MERALFSENLQDCVYDQAILKETQREQGSQAVCIHIGRLKHILALECVTRGKLSEFAACPRAPQPASTWRRLLF